MALTRGGFVATTNRMVVLFTMMNAATDVASAISAAAMDRPGWIDWNKTGPTGWTRDRKRITTKKPIRWATLAPIGQRSRSRVCAAREIGIDHYIAGAYLCGMLKRGFGEGTTAVCRTVSKSTFWWPLAAAHRKMFMPKQRLHTHEEVFKDHVSGQYDETIFRFRVPGGWIYTHTIIRFGSVDKNYVADTFVPDSVDMDLPIHHTDDPRRDF